MFSQVNYNYKLLLYWKFGPKNRFWSALLLFSYTSGMKLLLTRHASHGRVTVSQEPYTDVSQRPK